MKLNTFQLLQQSNSDYLSYMNSIHQLASQIEPNETIDCYEWLIHRLSDLPFQQSEIISLIIVCLNNLAVGHHKYELIAKKILKFVRDSLLKNGQIHFNQSTWIDLNYINHINIAKIQFQLGNYGKAFLESERALTLFESKALKNIRDSPSHQEVSMLINGYILLAKSYQCSDSFDLGRVTARSVLLQKGCNSKQFLDNAKKLAIKYLGLQDALCKRVLLYTQVKTPFPIKISSNQTIVQLDKQKIMRINKLIQFVKSLVPIKRLQKNAYEKQKQIQVFRSFIKEQKQLEQQQKQLTEESQKSQGQKTKRNIRVRKSYNTRQSVDEQTSQDTTTETQRQANNNNFTIQSKIQIEKMINVQVEDKLKGFAEQSSNLSKQYQDLMSELIKINKEKQQYEKTVKEQKVDIQTLQSEINLLKREVQETEKQKLDLTFQEVSKCQQQIKALSDQNSQLQVFLKSMRSNYIHEFNESSNRTTPPFLFDKQGQNSEKSVKSIPNTARNGFEKKAHKSLSEIRTNEFDDQYFSFTDSLTQQQINVSMNVNQIFKVKRYTACIEYELEIQLVPKGIQILDYLMKITAKIMNVTVIETLDMNQLQEFLSYTQNYHNMPFPTKYINDYKNFIQYLIMPFIQVYQAENKEYKIAIYQYPQGIDQDFNIKLYNVACRVWIQYLSFNTIRIVVYNQEQFVFQYDILFDYNKSEREQQTFLQYFNILSIDEFANIEAKDIQEYLQQNEEIKKSKQDQQQQKSMFYLPSIQVKNIELFLKFIEDQLKYIETTFVDQQIQSIQDLQNKFNSEIKLVQIRIEDNKQTIVYIEEKQNKLLINMQNLYQTHKPNKELVYAKGQQEISDHLVNNLYSIDFSKLDTLERLDILQNLVQLFDLYIFKTVLEEDDYDCYKENAIIMKEQDFGGTVTIYTGDTYKVPVTLTILGANHIPQYIRVDVYNEDTCQLNGILFHISNDYWIKISEQENQKNVKGGKNGKKQQKYQKEFKVQGNYNLYQLLSDCGLNILLHYILISEDKELFISNHKNENIIAKLESYLHMKNIIGYNLNK